MDPAPTAPEPDVSPTPSWSAEATAALIEAWNRGAKPAELALRLGVSIGAIHARVRGLRRQGVALQARQTPRGAVPPEARRNKRARRRCLTCGKKFRSTHIGNRICEPCLLLSGLF